MPLSSFAEVARANAAVFDGREWGAHDVRLTMAWAYIGAPTATIVGFLQPGLGAHALDDIALLSPADRNAKLVAALGHGFGRPNDLDASLQVSPDRNCRGGMYEHSLALPGPAALEALGLGRSYQPTTTDQIVLEFCPFLAVLFSQVALKVGEATAVSTLLKDFWTGAGLAWEPTWDAHPADQATTHPPSTPASPPSAPPQAGGSPPSSPTVSPPLPAPASPPPVQLTASAQALQRVRLEAANALEAIRTQFPGGGGGPWVHRLRDLAQQIHDLPR